MPTPSLDDIKATTEKAVSFVEWLTEVLRSKNWVTLLLLFDVLLAAVFNPLYFQLILELFTSQKLPTHYSLFFWLVIGLLFLSAMVVAVRTLPRKVEAGPSAIKRSTIKGLLPFGFEDAELFVRLQREQELKECLNAITDRDFRLGILCGESGCGKTSFLQAGLWPRLQDEKVSHGCVYVKFTDLDPQESVRQAIADQLQLPNEKVESSDFLALLETAAQVQSKPMVLLFDQFEQFFVHCKLKRERDAFIHSLAAWYKRPSLPVKIVFCVRGDFSDRLIELQKVMGYSLGPHNFMRLEVFTPEQATEVFRAIADSEAIAFDERFVREITEKELARREDGLISPVDLQILAWMIGAQKTAEERAFNRAAYQKLGGVEGLLERFLRRALDARETERRRQGALKVLLALTDLERNARAGLLTVENLHQKMAGTVGAGEIDDAVAWLARGDVRLINSTPRNGTVGYELAHERLIPALRRLAGKELSLADQANHLLDRRVKEWLGNGRASRYLLTWGELRLVQRQLHCRWSPIACDGGWAR